VFLSAVTMILFGIFMKERKRKKIQKAKENATEGIFRDGPTNIDIWGSSYRNNESAAKETMDEDNCGDDNNGETLIENMADKKEDIYFETIDIENLPSSRDEDSKIV
jgi:hypothetical protein